MANYNTFTSKEEVSSLPGRISVITTDWSSACNSIPDGIEIKDYEDGKEVPGSEQYFDLIGPDDKILDAKLQENVFVSEEAKGFYDEKLKQAQDFRDANCNIGVYAERLEQEAKRESEENAEDPDECYDEY